MSAADTGESTAAINRRSDDDAWAKLEPLMRQGHMLVYEHRVRRAYIDGHTTGGISKTRLRMLVINRTLRWVALDRYVLWNAGEATA